MSPKTIAYVVTTGLFSLALGGSAIAYLTHQPFLVEGVVEHLGYPMHVLDVLGTAKLLGVVALLAPVWPRLKEWAYAGFVFNLIGASWAHAATGDAVGEIAAPLVLLGVLAVSYATRPARLAVQAVEAPPVDVARPALAA